jgi:hypothetical protein
LRFVLAAPKQQRAEASQQREIRILHFHVRQHCENTDRWAEQEQQMAAERAEIPTANGRAERSPP